MSDEVITGRLAAIHSNLRALHAAGASLTSPSRGIERELFLSTFLREIFPVPYRFGTGDVTDRFGHCSRQCDIVVEYPFVPSLPFFARGPRLYLAEGVAAVIEIKSDLTKQWSEVEAWAHSFESLERHLDGPHQMGAFPPIIPRFAVGYRGWENLKTVRRYVDALKLDGALVIGDKGLYVSRGVLPALELEGPQSLWGLISSLHAAMTCVQVAGIQLEDYVGGGST